MTIDEFVKLNQNVRPSADIQERWASRIEKNILHTRGADGADAYIGQFGKGMKAPKAVMFARMAELKGCQDMANRFWEHAFFFATGQPVSLKGNTVPTSAAVDLPSVALKESFGQLPELPTPVSYEEALSLATNARFGVQEKIDGRHLLIRVKNGVVTAGNKKGLTTIPQMTITDAVQAIGHDIELDGENVNGVYYAYDLLSFDAINYRTHSYAVRYDALNSLLKNAEIPNLKLVRLETKPDGKLDLIKDLKNRAKEGFILKPLDALYLPGENGMRKHQFRAMNTFIVGARNGAKSSVAISVLRPDGSSRDMGNLTIPGKQPIPAIGSIVEVEYLYCHLGTDGKLHQPVFKELRDDVAASDCVEAKLKFKAADDE